MSVMRIFWKGSMDELTMSEGYSVFFALGAFFPGYGHRCLAVRPVLPQRPRPGLDSVDALLRPAQLPGIGALAAPDLRSVLQALVQARNP